MRLYFILSFQTLLSDSLIQSASSLRNLKNLKVTQRELLDNELFDCDKGCDMAIGSPVCGNDDISYQNQCLAYCQNAVIKSAGECSGHHSMTDGTYENVVVTKEQLDRFKDENFVFVAKRNFETSKDEHNVSNKHATSNNGVFYAHRMTNNGDEYISKIDLRGIDLDSNSTKAQLPLWMMESSSTRRLQGSTKGGSSGERGIVGIDSRSKVCLRESCYPYSTIGEFLSASGGHSCTGTVISTSAVLTNAHCRFKDGKFTDIDTFIPGRYRKYAVAYEPTDAGQVVTPYGSWSPQYWTILNGWYNAYELKYDIAIAHFNPKLYRGSSEKNSDLNIGEYTGFVGIAATTNDSAELQKATVTGYPYDKPVGEMWTSGPCAGGFQAGYEDVITYHGCDSVKGNDGSALLDLDAQIAYGVDVAEVPVNPNNPDQTFVNIGVIFHEDNMHLIKMFLGQ